MNYTDLAREEILKSIDLDKDTDKVAFLAGVTKALGSIQLFKNSAFGLEYEIKEEDLAMKIVDLIKELFGLELDFGYNSTEPRVYTISIDGKVANEMLKALGLSYFDNKEYVVDNNTNYIKNINNMYKSQSYIQGVFVGVGSVYFPEGAEAERGYHLELSFFEEDYALAVQELLNKSNINLSFIERTNSFALYSKSSQVISDMLAFMKAMESVMKLNDAAIQREVNNNVNRESNLMASNYDKVLTANSKYISAISYIDEKIGIDRLDEKMAAICHARIEDKQASMQVIADKLGITKSALNRALNKIVGQAQDLKLKEE